MKQAAVSLVERGDLVLAVWNRGYKGWSLPGGKVEPGESLVDAQVRELREETGLATVSQVAVYDAPSAVSESDNMHVHVFQAEVKGDPRQVEDGCPVTWMTRRNLVNISPFKAFYAKMFEAIGRAV